MSSDKKTITLLKEVINSYLPGAEIIMFGSRARGEESPWSDYDLLVIARETLTDRQRLNFQAQIRKSLAKKLILADIIVHSRDDIPKKQRLPGHIVRAALKEGVRV
jgi:predicted nucleotidyltransferase